jgi:hypothetical protein
MTLMPIVCITGMHRSGTSMVAGLLRQCGLYLGPDEELMPPTADNADGYWENLRFVEINDELLLHLNGSWHSPPSADAEAELQSAPALLVEKARKLIEDFDGQRAWGWKDPRSSLTLPFWQAHIPNLKVINCVRNPLEIAESLAKRDGFSRSLSVELWHTYYARLLSAAPDNSLTTHYDAYFAYPREELGRVLDFIGLRADARKVDEACAAVKRPLRHNRETLEHVIAEGTPIKVIVLYARMCMQAGPVYLNALRSGALEPADVRGGGSSDLESALLDRLAENDAVVQVLAAHLRKKEQIVQSLAAQVHEQEQQLALIRNSRGWRFLQSLRGLRDRLTRTKS